MWKGTIAVVAGVLLFDAASLVPQVVNPARPDSADVKRHLDAAQKTAGTAWAPAFEFFCAADPNSPRRANRADDPLIEPARLFDNVYAIGRTGTVVYAITTSEGIILIDSGYADQVESVLLPGMKQLGLDPAKIKYVVVTHGHGDHFGGSKYLQDQYGARIVVSAADWDVMAQGGRGPAVPQPKRDLVAEEGQPISLGDEKVSVVFVPGHTPGAIGVIFPVREGRTTHMAALFGGTWLTANLLSDGALQQFTQSLDRFSEATRKMKVDVELQNHPLYDGFGDKLSKLRTRKAGERNPFIVGEAGYQQFLKVISECTRVQSGRRAS